MKHRLRGTAVAAIALAGTLGLSGCAVFSPATVLKPYVPSDGVGASIGDMEVRNVLVVSNGVDQPGVVSMVLANGGTDQLQVRVSANVGSGTPPSASFTVVGGTSFLVGSPAGAVETAATDQESDHTGWFQIPQVPVVPGADMPLTVDVNGARTTIQALVVRPCFAYAAITPTPTSATDTPSPSPTDCGPDEGETPSSS